jgi:hypothetical protein
MTTTMMMMIIIIVVAVVVIIINVKTTSTITERCSLVVDSPPSHSKGLRFKCRPIYRLS